MLTDFSSIILTPFVALIKVKGGEIDRHQLLWSQMNKHLKTQIAFISLYLYNICFIRFQ